MRPSLSGCVILPAAGIEGLPSFVAGSAKFALGADSAAIKEGRVASLQTLSGTGSLRVCADVLIKLGGVAELYLPKPSWGNHAKIFGTAGLEVREYGYLDERGTALDFDLMANDLNSLAPASVVLLHAAAHNPTGVDPTQSQWDELAHLFASKRLVPLFDTAYQGFASGDCVRDAYPLRTFEEAGVNSIMCQSFAKNMGLYGERVGAIHMVCSSVDESKAVLSRVKQEVIRPNYSSPPRHGAEIAAEILNDDTLLAEWHAQLLTMSQRIKDVRTALRTELERIGAPGEWNHIEEQIGEGGYTYPSLLTPWVESDRILTLFSTAYPVNICSFLTLVLIETLLQECLRSLV